MDNRLLIKSTICAHDKDADLALDDAKYVVDEVTKTLTITASGSVKTIPIDEYALSLKGRD